MWDFFPQRNLGHFPSGKVAAAVKLPSQTDPSLVVGVGGSFALLLSAVDVSLSSVVIVPLA